MPTQDHLFKNLLKGTAPLLVWAAHFSFSYVFVAVACIAGLDGVYIVGMPALNAALLLGSMLAIAATAALLWRAARQVCRNNGSGRLLDVSQAGSAVLALVGIVWTSVPMLMLGGCR